MKGKVSDKEAKDHQKRLEQLKNQVSKNMPLKLNNNEYKKFQEEVHKKSQARKLSVIATRQLSTADG